MKSHKAPDSSLAPALPGRLAYVTNYMTDTVTGLTIDESTGTVFQIIGATISTGKDPVDLVVDASSRFLYVVENRANKISAYAIDASTGMLAPVAGSPFKTKANRANYGILYGANRTNRANAPNSDR